MPSPTNANSQAAAERTQVAIEDSGVARLVFGPRNSHLQLIEKASGIHIDVRDASLWLSGDVAQVHLVEQLLRELACLAAEGRSLGSAMVSQALKTKMADPQVALRDIFSDAIGVTNRRQSITPQGLGQKQYVDAIRHHDVVFGIGPAGTGKTYLAVAMAVAALKRQEVRRIVITRPAVEAGERLGFLPGALEDKINPYLRPLHDALNDMVEAEQVTRWTERGILEVAPLAYMRGRTLNDAFILLDEAQNTTSLQMKMFLTRLGFGSKAVINGDVTQVDLAPGHCSGLMEAEKILASTKGIAFCRFTDKDVVRHPLVQDVIRAYERFGCKG